MRCRPTCAAHPVPKRFLVDFARLSLAAGGREKLRFAVPLSRFSIATANGSRRVYAGAHQLQLWRGNGAPTTITVQLPQVA